MRAENHVMVDLETLGTGPSAVILSIGAVRFGALLGVDEPGFYTAVTLESSMAAGLVADASTVKWWMQQPRNARVSAFSDTDAVHLHQALEEFRDFLPPKATIWGNGADFDNVILGSAFRACGMPQPWGPYSNRCYRTMKDLCRQVDMKRVGVHHNALDDAKSQALHLIDIFKHLKIW